MTELIPAPDLTTLLPSGLTQAEAEFVWNLEGLGLPGRRAASLAGVPYGLMCKPQIVQAREALKTAMRGAMALTRDDVLFGIREAIDRARLISEPATEIMGWEKIAKIAGLDAPQKIDINITASVAVLKGHVRAMSDADLAKFVGGTGNIIDVDFYPVKGE